MKAVSIFGESREMGEWTTAFRVRAEQGVPLPFQGAVYHWYEGGVHTPVSSQAGVPNVFSRLRSYNGRRLT